MTMPNAQCPQCSALLPPGAVKCSYCGFATPWGAVLSQQNERAAYLQADQAKRQRIAAAVSSARTGMILAIVGLPICCGPLSIAGGIMGWRAGNLATAEGEPRPGTAVVALVLAIVSTLSFTTAMVLFIQNERAKAAHTAEVRDRLKGRRDAETLDQKLACDLVEERLADKGWGNESYDLKDVHCDGAFSVDGRRASQIDVRFAFGDKRFTMNACFEKRSRWFVLKIGDGLSCAALPPPAEFTAPARKFSDEEANADEEKARADMARGADAAAVKLFVERLAKVRTDAAAAPAATTCTKEDMAKYVSGSTRRKIAAVDFDLLDAGTANVAWAMLTSDGVRLILDEKTKIEDRARALEGLQLESGKLLGVYKALRKTWPVVKGKAAGDKDFSFAGGEYDGYLLVYDYEAGRRLCGAKVAFENSDEVDFKKSRINSEKASAKDAVEADFRDHFETAATDAIKKAAPDLRLGYKVVE